MDKRELPLCLAGISIHYEILGMIREEFATCETYNADRTTWCGMGAFCLLLFVVCFVCLHP